jgi:arsenical pump membrane protein
MTPVVFSMLKAMKVPEKTYLAFIFSIGFISDTASMPFTISNLVNILTTQYFSISFIGYLRVMVIPDIVSIFASSILLFLYFRKSIPERMSLPENFTINRSGSPLLKFAPIVLSVLVIAYAITGIYGIPVSLIALPFSLLVLYIGHRRKEIQGLRVLKASPWQIVLFSVGMYIVVFGLSQAGLTNMISDLLELIVKTPGPSNYVLSGYLFAFLASTMNNLPSVMIGNLSISALGNHSYLVYANVLANDIGPKFTPIGSLATLLWMDTLRRKEGIPISAAFYMKTGFIMALPVLTLSLLSLMLVT